MPPLSVFLPPIFSKYEPCQALVGPLHQKVYYFTIIIARYFDREDTFGGSGATLQVIGIKIKTFFKQSITLGLAAAYIILSSIFERVRKCIVNTLPSTLCRNWHRGIVCKYLLGSFYSRLGLNSMLMGRP